MSSAEKPKKSTALYYLIEAIDGLVNFNQFNEHFEHMFGTALVNAWGGTMYKGDASMVFPMGLLLRTRKDESAAATVQRAREQWKKKNTCYLSFRAEKSNLLPILQQFVKEGAIDETYLTQPVMIRIDAIQEHRLYDESLGIDMDTLFLRVDLNSLKPIPEHTESLFDD